ncbi:helix-turn-helix domain-containing protein [Bacteroides caecimuris]|jgi:transcriptional regulator with XRE-family HTH domain|uniref:helix-turn-helix domain-containing protein n=1 Tax=Bacteroides caecimuris TaxID=1796613 RepID=UPI002570FA36|nr:helix-turn-helix transcriptional regulator [Bacteroides caecimuris]
MTFREYYQKLKKLERPMHPAKAFVYSIADMTGRSPRTVNQWLSGVQQPPKGVCLQIGEKLGIDPETLFPKESVK